MPARPGRGRASASKKVQLLLLRRPLAASKCGGCQEQSRREEGSAASLVRPLPPLLGSEATQKQQRNEQQETDFRREKRRATHARTHTEREGWKAAAAAGRGHESSFAARRGARQTASSDSTWVAYTLAGGLQREDARALLQLDLPSQAQLGDDLQSFMAQAAHAVLLLETHPLLSYSPTAQRPPRTVRLLSSLSFSAC